MYMSNTDYNTFEDIPDFAFSEAVEEVFGQYNLKLNHNGTEYNFVCPHCGDLEKTPNKRKAYVYTDKWLYTCFKCCSPTHIMYYFKDNNPDVYQKLLFYQYGKNKKTNNSSRKKQENPFINLPFKDGELVSLYDDNELSKQALQVCIDRNINKRIYDRWYVCLKDSKFFDKDSFGNIIIDPITHKPIGNKYNSRIIIPYYKFGGKWNQFDARAIDKNNTLRYLNFSGVSRDMYNIDFINFNKPFYLLEGTIDSLFIHNAASFGGAQHLKPFLEKYPKILENKENCTVIWDNDDTGIEEMFKTVKLGLNWFDWDGVVPNKNNIGKTIKDINNAVLYTDLFPLDDKGFIKKEYIEYRSRSADMGEYYLLMKYGNKIKEKYIDKCNKYKNNTKQNSIGVLF